MAHNDSPDRRPLLYGFAALLILIAAGFLFWPRGDRTDEPGLVLTPNAEQGQLASQIETSSEDPPAVQDPVSAGAGADVAPEEIQSQPITETEYAVESEPARSSSTQSSATTSTTDALASDVSGRQPETTSGQAGRQEAPRATDLNRPGPSGRYLLNLGSFSTRENAQRRATELQGKGVPAEISQGTKADGSPVYRVRVGCFKGRSWAKTYGEELKSRHQIDYWIAER